LACFNPSFAVLIPVEEAISKQRVKTLSDSTRHLARISVILIGVAVAYKLCPLLSLFGLELQSPVCQRMGSCFSSAPAENPRVSRPAGQPHAGNPWFGIGTAKLSTVESSYATEINDEKY